MTDKQKYAIKLAINTMDKYFGKHYNTAYCNRETGVSVGYGEAINILSDMLSNADVHTCNCQHNNNSRDSEPCCRCDSRKTNADRIRNMSDEELAELITGSLNFDCADYCDSFTQGCAFNCGKKDREIAVKWLQSEAEQVKI